jgi:plastocyanin
MRHRRGIARGALLLLAVPLAGVLATGTASAGGSCHEKPTVTRGVAVRIAHVCFGPTVLYVRPGTRVTWTNTDDVLHTVTGLGFSWGSGDSLGMGDTLAYRFTRTGVYPYTCIIHPGMVGAVVVGDAGSPQTAAGAVPPALAGTSLPAGATQAGPAPIRTVAASQSAARGSSAWRTVCLVTLGVLVAGAATLAVRRRQRTRGVPEPAS